jgi:putative lipoprotein
MYLLKTVSITSRFFMLIIACLVITGCAGTTSKDDNWFSEDKAYHFAASALIGAGVSSAAKDSGSSTCEAATAGISITLVVGAGKEYYDKHKNNGNWSWKDMFWNLAGGTAGSLAATGCH